MGTPRRRIRLHLVRPHGPGASPTASPNAGHAPCWWTRKKPKAKDEFADGLEPRRRWPKSAEALASVAALGVSTLPAIAAIRRASALPAGRCGRGGGTGRSCRDRVRGGAEVLGTPKRRNRLPPCLTHMPNDGAILRRRATSTSFPVDRIFWLYQGGRRTFLNALGSIRRSTRCRSCRIFLCSPTDATESRSARTAARLSTYVCLYERHVRSRQSVCIGEDSSIHNRDELRFGIMFCRRPATFVRGEIQALAMNEAARRGRPEGDGRGARGSDCQGGHLSASASASAFWGFWSSIDWGGGDILYTTQQLNLRDASYSLKMIAVKGAPPMVNSQNMKEGRNWAQDRFRFFLRLNSKMEWSKRIVRGAWRIFF